MESKSQPRLQNFCMQLLRGAVGVAFFSLLGHMTIHVETERDQRLSGLATRTGLAILNGERTSKKQNPGSDHPVALALDIAWL
jgi:hypothetical protein